ASRATHSSSTTTIRVPTRFRRTDAVDTPTAGRIRASVRSRPASATRKSPAGSTPPTTPSYGSEPLVGPLLHAGRGASSQSMSDRDHEHEKHPQDQRAPDEADRALHVIDIGFVAESHLRPEFDTAAVA